MILGLYFVDKIVIGILVVFLLLLTGGLVSK